MQQLPQTPQDVARAVLDGIAAMPGSFNMDNWVFLDSGAALEPTQPACGTTMCAAGWAAHVTGWTLRYSRGETFGEENGLPVYLYAEKGDERRLISKVAQEVLGLEYHETFWYSSEDEALERLREIAGV